MCGLTSNIHLRDVPLTTESEGGEGNPLELPQDSGPWSNRVFTQARTKIEIPQNLRPLSDRAAGLPHICPQALTVELFFLPIWLVSNLLGYENPHLWDPGILFYFWVNERIYWIANGGHRVVTPSVPSVRWYRPVQAFSVNLPDNKSHTSQHNDHRYDPFSACHRVKIPVSHCTYNISYI